jgi:membrane protease YdiL (CAAX protease family)
VSLKHHEAREATHPIDVLEAAPGGRNTLGQLGLRFFRHLSLRYNSLPEFLPSVRQFGVVPILCFWGLLSLAAALYGAWLGSGGRSFAAALTTFILQLLVMLLFAARGVTEAFAGRAGPAAGTLLGAGLFLAYLIYALGTNTFTLARAAVVLGLVFIPLALAFLAARESPPAWQDFVTLAGVWAAAKFSRAEWLWPVPGGKLSHIFTVLLMVDVGIAVFLLTPRVAGTGYAAGWSARWGIYVAGGFLSFAAIAIPLGLAMHFVSFSPRWSSLPSLPAVALGILVFTAWPEEFLFRGLLQNMLSRSYHNEFAAWCVASVLFGLSHITNGHFPNWRYVALATMAGFFYGWTWRKTGSIFASAMVHALVDAAWHFFFRTL